MDSNFVFPGLHVSQTMLMGFFFPTRFLSALIGLRDMPLSALIGHRDPLHLYKNLTYIFQWLLHKLISRHKISDKNEKIDTLSSFFFPFYGPIKLSGSRQSCYRSYLA